MSLFENLNSIYSIKNDIKSVLEDKGIDMTIYSFPDYPSVINDLSTGGNMSTLSVSENGTYYPETGYDGFSEVSVNVIPNLGYDYVFSSNGFYSPEAYGYDGFAKIGVDVPPYSVEGFTEKDVTEGVQIVNLSNSASYVHSFVYEKDTYLQTVNLPNCSIVNENAFAYCTNLTTVSLPTCQTVGSYAFQSCYSLVNVNLPECSRISSYGFNACVRLSTISLPSCKTIGQNAFERCSSLMSVYLPECINIEQNAFTSCSSLQSIDLPKLSYGLNTWAFQNCTSLTQVNLPICPMIYDQVFENCYVLQSIDLPMCTEIRKEVFKGCSSLSQVSLPICMSLGQGAFISCSSLTEIELPPMCITMGTSVFQNCINLKSVDFNIVVDVPTNTFIGCSSIESISAKYACWFRASLGSNSVISEMSLPCIFYMSNDIFKNCTALTSLTLGTGTYKIPSYNGNMLTGTPIMSGTGSIYVDAAMYDKWITTTGWSSLSARFVSVGNTDPMLSFSDGLVYGKTTVLMNGFEGDLGKTGGNITEISLPQCEYINTSVGYRFTNLSNISLPVCAVIRQDTFQSCTSLTSLYLPEVRYIFSNAFKNCNSLINVNLPKCEYIGSSAFYAGNYSTGLTLTLGSTQVVRNDGAFGLTTMKSIYVPASLVDAYKVAKGWSGYSNKIFPISE